MLVPISSFAVHQVDRRVRRSWWATTTTPPFASAVPPSPALPAATQLPRWSVSPAHLAARLRLSNGPDNRCRRSSSGSQAPLSARVLGAASCFCCLAALYESWTIPLVGPSRGPARHPRRRARDDAARLAERRVLQRRPRSPSSVLPPRTRILIIEFAKDLHAQGKPLVEAAIEACRTCAFVRSS